MNPPPLPNDWIAPLPAAPRTVGPHNAPPDALLLHLGEAWYPPAPSVVAELSSLSPLLGRYPDSLSVDLSTALAAYAGVHADQVVVGNGSDGLIDLIVTAYAGPDRPVVAPAPTFFVYGATAALRRAPLFTAGRRSQAEGFVFDVEPFLASLPPNPGVIFLANPNNPTGGLIPPADLARIAAATSALVVVDECYFEFAGTTALELLSAHANVLILRSLSKSFALAGLRVGYALAHPAIVQTLAKVDQVFSVNLAAQRCALAALRSLDYYRPLFARTAELRALWSEALTGLGLRVFPSAANILLVDYSALTPENVAPVLRERGIFVADFHARPGLQNCFRVAVDEGSALRRFTEVFSVCFPRK